MTHIVIFTVLLLLVCGVVCWCFYSIADYHKERAKYWHDEYIQMRNNYLEDHKNKMKL